MDSARNALLAAQSIAGEISSLTLPADTGRAARSQHVVLNSLTRDTRGYIERIADQANGTYEQGWYDACAVMIRRLLETLLVEAFEANSIDHKIKNGTGDFFYLRDMISVALAETAWNLSRNCKAALPRLKDVGDKSAHSRRFVAQRGDIDKLLDDVRVVVQELLILAKLK